MDESLSAVDADKPPSARALPLNYFSASPKKNHVVLTKQSDFSTLSAKSKPITQQSISSYDPVIKGHLRSHIIISDRARDFKNKFYPDIDDETWNDWHWQISNRIRSIDKLKEITSLSDSEIQAIESHKGPLPFAITPYYASLIEPDNFEQAIRRTVIMTNEENILSPHEAVDPLGEEDDSPTPGIVHRYPDRVLFLTTGFCSVYCRYCTRSRLVGKAGGEYTYDLKRWEKGIQYIREHTEVRDVLISGGDPLTIDDKKLEWLLSNLKDIPHVEFIRIGSKVPVVLPQRITPKLVNMLRKYHPLWMSIHFTHPDEITLEASGACSQLANAGIPLGSQTVLLKGINDNVDTMKRLVHGLLKIRVKPYYLYQCDPVAGTSHFRTKVSKGLEIITGLRGFTSGYAVPHYVIDAPGGGGKIPLLPDYYQGSENGMVVLKNFENKLFFYPNSDDEKLSPRNSHSCGDK